MALSNHGAFERKDVGISVNPKETQQAYEIRAALEEVGGRAAARVLKGNTAALRDELETMRAAFDRLDLDSFVEHDIAFHRNILEASQNEVLLRVWDSLAIDLRIRAAVGKISGIFPNWLNHIAQFSMPLRWGEVERPDSCCGITSRRSWSFSRNRNPIRNSTEC